MDWMQVFYFSLIVSIAIIVLSTIVFNLVARYSKWRDICGILIALSVLAGVGSILGIAIEADNRDLAKDQKRGCALVFSDRVAVTYNGNPYILDEGVVKICEKEG